MSIFEIIHDVQTLRDAIKDKPEIRFNTKPNGCEVCCYVISNNDTFNSMLARECRGITFKDGVVIGRGLHKFFNLNELPQTQISILPWDEVVSIQEKTDGSMIHTVAVKSKDLTFSLKSKKAFDTSVAVGAYNFMLSSSEAVKYVKFCEKLIELKLTAIFEYTSPLARIVVAYPENLSLLHVRDNLTGEYKSRQQLTKWSQEFNIPLVKEAFSSIELIEIKKDPSKLIDLAKVTEGIEGWIIQFSSGEMVKLKTAWYNERHHLMTFWRVRDVAKMALDEKLDDFKAELADKFLDLSEMLEIESRLVADIGEIVAEVEQIHLVDCHLDRKSFAQKHHSHRYFGLLMQKYSGHEPNYKEFYRKVYLDERFDLRQLTMFDDVKKNV